MQKQQDDSLAVDKDLSKQLKSMAAAAKSITKAVAAAGSDAAATKAALQKHTDGLTADFEQQAAALAAAEGAGRAAVAAAEEGGWAALDGGAAAISKAARAAAKVVEAAGEQDGKRMEGIEGAATEAEAAMAGAGLRCCLEGQECARLFCVHHQPAQTHHQHDATNQPAPPRSLWRAARVRPVGHRRRPRRRRRRRARARAAAAAQPVHLRHPRRVAGRGSALPAPRGPPRVFQGREGGRRRGEAPGWLGPLLVAFLGDSWTFLLTNNNP
jgi:hypothetical protein